MAPTQKWEQASDKRNTKRISSTKLGPSFHNHQIVPVRKFKLPASFVDWSLSMDAEKDYYYRITCLFGEKRIEFYCLVTSFLDLLLIRCRFFESVEEKMKEVFPKDY